MVQGTGARQVRVNPQESDGENVDETDDQFDADMAGMSLGGEPVAQQESPASPEGRRFHMENPRTLEALRRGDNPDLPIPEHGTYPTPGPTREEGQMFSRAFLGSMEQLSHDENYVEHSVAQPVVQQANPPPPGDGEWTFHTDNPRALEALRKGYNPYLPIPEHLTYPPPGLTREQWLIEQMCHDEENFDHEEEESTLDQETLEPTQLDRDEMIGSFIRVDRDD